ncbi:MAG: pyruvate ferredoxin oxidoreductase [Spirochaetales bacterium]|nr:MAG: pyruvate ferredoxin oxidoreductase [Spirochaetales bacterium]
MNGTFNIYMAGVGGQGIGLLAELLARAADHAGLSLRGCDTHGLAQRGGMVTSHLRLGVAYSPLIPDGQADLVIALERTEALRSARSMLKEGGAVIWYDATWQALDVRTGANPPVAADDVRKAAESKGAAAHPVRRDDLPDTRMQNVAVVAEALRLALIPGIELDHVKAAMSDLMAGPGLETNLALLG